MNSNYATYSVIKMNGAALLHYSATLDGYLDEKYEAASSTLKARRIAEHHALKAFGQVLNWEKNRNGQIALLENCIEC